MSLLSVLSFIATLVRGDVRLDFVQEGVDTPIKGFRVPSTFGYQAVQEQKVKNNDQFLRSNIRNPIAELAQICFHLDNLLTYCNTFDMEQSTRFKQKAFVRDQVMAAMYSASTPCIELPVGNGGLLITSCKY
jgi:hypothetical protein